MDSTTRLWRQSWPATVPNTRQVEERPPELVIALLPILVRTMLAAFVEVLAEQQR